MLFYMFQLEQETAVILSSIIIQRDSSKKTESGVSGKFKNQLEPSHTDTIHTHTQSQHSVYVVTGHVCTVSRGNSSIFCLWLKVWVKIEREVRWISASFFLHCICTEARGMELYLGARENTDALTFKKAASHSRQNHATRLPLCAARIYPGACSPHPFHCMLGSKQTHTHIEKHIQNAPVHVSYVWICWVCGGSCHKNDRIGTSYHSKIDVSQNNTL